MKILSYHPEQDTIRIKVESLEDLWHLDHILEVGDRLRAKTYRRKDQRTDMLRAQRAEKKPVTLTIRVEKIEFHQYSAWLRATGLIEEGDDTGSYHTINIEEGSICTIIKQWKSHQLDRLQEAVAQTMTPKILIVVMDDEEADFGIIRQFGVEQTATVYSQIPGKRDPAQRKARKLQFYEDVSEKIREYDLPTIVAGPGFTKEEFKTYFSSGSDKHLTIESVSTTGKTGLYEVIKKGLVERVFQDSKTAADIQLIEELFSLIVQDMAVYGMEEVSRAIEYNACERLLLADSLLRTDRRAEDLLEKARQKGGEAHIISTQHEGGEKLEHLGGIAAILRFKIG
jgi:protein pelota